MTRVWLLIPVIVILEPYKGIKYNQINAYEIIKECKKDCIEVHEPEEVEPPESDESTAWDDYLRLKYGME